MTLGEHLEEFRRRIFWSLVGLAVSTGACLYFAPSIIEMLKGPYVEVMEHYELKPELTVLDVTAGFTNYMKVALYAGLVVSCPWIAYHFWVFVSVGLHSSEKRKLLFAVPSSAFLFLCGAAFFLLVVSKPILFFFIGLTRWLGMIPMITFENHISFMTGLMVVFGLGFQTPLVTLLLGKLGLVTVRTLNHYRRHVIVGMFIFAAAFTSPSPVDQILLAIPMWLLFELGVLLVYLFVDKRPTR